MRPNSPSVGQFKPTLADQRENDQMMQIIPIETNAVLAVIQLKIRWYRIPNPFKTVLFIVNNHSALRSATKCYQSFTSIAQIMVQHRCQLGPGWQTPTSLSIGDWGLAETCDWRQLPNEQAFAPVHRSPGHDKLYGVLFWLWQVCHIDF